MDESRNQTSTSDPLPTGSNVSEVTLNPAGVISAVAVLSSLLGLCCYYLLLLRRHRYRARQHLSPDVETLDASEDREFIQRKESRDEIGLPQQNLGLSDASELSENADIIPVSDFYPVNVVEDRRYIQHRYSTYYLGIDERGLHLRKQPDDHPNNAVMTMVQYFGYDSELQTAVHVYVIHNGSTCVCADDHDLVDNLSLMQPEADLNAKELNIDGGRIFFRTHVVEKNYVCFESTYKEGHFLVADKDKVVRLMKTNTEDIKTHFRLRQH